jgi:hypothetical protein
MSSTPAQTQVKFEFSLGAASLIAGTVRASHATSRSSSQPHLLHLADHLLRQQTPTPASDQPTPLGPDQVLQGPDRARTSPDISLRVTELESPPKANTRSQRHQIRAKTTYSRHLSNPNPGAARSARLIPHLHKQHWPTPKQTNTPPARPQQQATTPPTHATRDEKTHSRLWGQGPPPPQRWPAAAVARAGSFLGGARLAPESPG